MTNFKLNTSILEQNILKYKNFKKECILDINSAYNSLKNVDSGWNDDDTKIFLDIIKNDRYKINNYFGDIDKLYKQIEILKNSFQNLCVRYGYTRNPTIVYNDECYQLLLTNLNNIISYLNNSLYYINCCRFNSKFGSLYRVYTLRNEIARLKNETRNIYNNVIVFKNNVDKILSNSQTEINKIGEVELNIEKMSYNWKLVD